MPKIITCSYRCDRCQLTAELELIPKLPPPSDWLVLKVKSGKDQREKIELAICPNCVESIKGALPVAPEAVNQQVAA
jgi:hypothetical protein